MSNALWCVKNGLADAYTNFIKELLKELTGGTTIEYQGNTLDFGKEEWNKINYSEYALQSSVPPAITWNTSILFESSSFLLAKGNY